MALANTNTDKTCGEDMEKQKEEKKKKKKKKMDWEGRN